jgi:hypothetical protein
MVLLQWYKELFKRVESTQKYTIDINNKIIHKVKLNLYSLAKYLSWLTRHNISEYVATWRITKFAFETNFCKFDLWNDPIP